MIRIRRMTACDILAICRIVRAAYEFLAEKEGFSPKQRRRLLEERCSAEWVGAQFMRCHSFVAVSGEEEIVGVVAVDGAEIAELFVAPSCHGRGIGAGLFSKAEEVIAESGHDRLEVTTTGHAVPFYEAMGATVTGPDIVLDGPLIGWHCTCLAKDLPKEPQAASHGRDSQPADKKRAGQDRSTGSRQVAQPPRLS